MANETRSEMKRPLTMILAAVAVIGWVAVAWLAVSRSRVQEDLNQQLNAAAAAQDELQASYDALQSASGELKDVQAQVGTEKETLAGITARRTAEKEAADTELGQLTQRIEAARRSFELDLAQVTAVGEAARGKLSGVQARLATLEDQSRSKQAELDDLRTRTLGEAERRMTQQVALGKAEQRIAANATELMEVGKELAQVRDQIAGARSTLAQLTDQSAGLSRELAQAEQRTQTAREAEAELKKQLTSARGEFDEMQAQKTGLDQSVATLTDRRQTLTSDIESAEKQRSRLQDQVTRLSQTLAERADELAKLEQRVASLQKKGSALSGAGSDSGASSVLPGVFAAGNATATFAPDGTFQLVRSDRSQSVTGDYEVKSGILTLNNAKGDTGSMQFPARCRLQPTPEGFELSEYEGSCSYLSNLSFAAEQP